MCRELTKLHETVVRGPLGELAELARDGTIPARGEIVIVVGWAGGGGSRSGGPGAGRVGTGPGAQEAHDAAVTAALAAVQRLVESGVARGEAARRVSAETGIPRRRLYALGDTAGAALGDTAGAGGRREGSSTP